MRRFYRESLEIGTSIFANLPWLIAEILYAAHHGIRNGFWVEPSVIFDPHQRDASTVQDALNFLVAGDALWLRVRFVVNFDGQHRFAGILEARDKIYGLLIDVSESVEPTFARCGRAYDGIQMDLREEIVVCSHVAHESLIAFQFGWGHKPILAGVVETRLSRAQEKIKTPDGDCKADEDRNREDQFCHRVILTKTT